ncbi:hypothetical protein T06_9776 [Trichinella sp. T6]|nr:hypothetical protein T06_9776 [Trichinella sp. T6]
MPSLRSSFHNDPCVLFMHEGNSSDGRVRRQHRPLQQPRSQLEPLVVGQLVNQAFILLRVPRGPAFFSSSYACS